MKKKMRYIKSRAKGSFQRHSSRRENNIPKRRKNTIQNRVNKCERSGSISLENSKNALEQEAISYRNKINKKRYYKHGKENIQQSVVEEGQEIKHSPQSERYNSDFVKTEDNKVCSDNKKIKGSKNQIPKNSYTANNTREKAGKLSEKQRKHNKSYKMEKKISKLEKKKQKMEKKAENKSLNKTTLRGAIIATEAVNKYIESGRNENAGIDAAYNVTDKTKKLLSGKYRNEKKVNIKNHKRLSKLNKSITAEKKKLFFHKNMEEMKNTPSYKNTSKLRQFFKRRQYKRQIQKKYKSLIKNKAEKFLTEVIKKFTEYIKMRAKKILLTVCAVIGIFFILFQLGSVIMNLGTGVVGNTISTTYLSSQETLREIHQHYSSLTQGLYEEMESADKAYPGYDEYIISGKEDIGYDVHELLSYITARYGVVKNLSEVEGELNNLFGQMYELTYKEETEIRYKTVQSSYTDKDGNVQTSTHEEAYEYKKLIASLKKTEMDSIIREVFYNYPDNLAHYEALLKSKGNMELVFGSGNNNPHEIINNPDFSNPGIEFSDESVRRIVDEAQKHIGKRYVFGANGPSNFDCSSFVCWVYTHSGIKNMPRTTAWGIYQSYCNPVSSNEAKPGDIIFFKGTYNSGRPISHVGIYVGDNYMIHAGDPIKYSRIDTTYWKSKFYGFGRVSG